MKAYRIAWSVSLILLACTVLVSVVCSFAGISLPDTLIRVFGALDLCALAALAYTSVKLRIWKEQKRADGEDKPEKIKKTGEPT